jgi:hypothetical protein
MREPEGLNRQPPEDAAQAFALSALAYLLDDPARTNRFLTVTGMDGESLPARLADPAFLGCVLDFVLEDEVLLLDVAETAGVPADRIGRLRMRLPGALPQG